MWINIKNVYTEIAKNVIGYKKKKDKTWLTPDTWMKPDDRRKTKDKVRSAKSLRLFERAQKEYKIKDNEFKRGDRKVKEPLLRSWLARQSRQRRTEHGVEDHKTSVQSRYQ